MLSFLGISIVDRFVVPQIVLIDKKGVIREQTEANPSATMPLQDETHLRGAIEKLLAEGASGKAAPASGASTKAATRPRSPYPKI